MLKGGANVCVVSQPDVGNEGLKLSTIQKYIREFRALSSKLTRSQRHYHQSRRLTDDDDLIESSQTQNWLFTLNKSMNYCTSSGLLGGTLVWCRRGGIWSSVITLTIVRFSRVQIVNQVTRDRESS